MREDLLSPLIEHCSSSAVDCALMSRPGMNFEEPKRRPRRPESLSPRSTQITQQVYLATKYFRSKVVLLLIFLGISSMVNVHFHNPNNRVKDVKGWLREGGR